MTYVIAQPCVDLKDRACVDECPVDCIYEGKRMLYIHPDECVDCGACEPVCPVEAIFYEDDTPEEWKAYYDANPPSKRSWLHSVFIDKVDPDRHQPLAGAEAYGWLAMNPGDNRENLTEEYLRDLDALDERRRNRFYLGLWSDDAANALWTVETLDRGR